MEPGKLFRTNGDPKIAAQLESVLPQTAQRELEMKYGMVHQLLLKPWRK